MIVIYFHQTIQNFYYFHNNFIISEAQNFSTFLMQNEETGYEGFARRFAPNEKNETI